MSNVSVLVQRRPSNQSARWAAEPVGTSGSSVRRSSDASRASGKACRRVAAAVVERWMRSMIR
eukprot:5422977-Prymnesium_polylepis.1